MVRQRLERAKQLAAWPTKELMQRYVADAGATANACLEKTEDTIKLLQELGLEGAWQAAASSLVAVLREHHNAVGQFFTKSEVVSKHGLDAMGVVLKHRVPFRVPLGLGPARVRPRQDLNPGAAVLATAAAQ